MNLFNIEKGINHGYVSYRCPMYGGARRHSGRDRGGSGGERGITYCYFILANV